MTATEVFKVIHDYRVKHDLDDPKKWPQNVFAIYANANWGIEVFESSIYPIVEYMLDTGEYESNIDYTEIEFELTSAINRLSNSFLFNPAVDALCDLLDIFKTKHLNEREQMHEKN